MHGLVTQDLDFNTATQAMALTAGETAFANRNLSAYGGDYWQAGKGYLGPTPAPEDRNSKRAAYQAAMLQIQRVFCAENVFLEIVSRQVSALMSRPPLIAFERRADSQQGRAGQDRQPGNVPPEVDPAPKPGGPPTGADIEDAPDPEEEDGLPTPDPQEFLEDKPKDPLIEEAQKIINEWLGSKRVRLAMARVFTRRLLTERGAMRLFAPPRFAFPEALQGKSLADVLNALGIDEPTLENARVIYDPNDASFMSLVKFGQTSLNPLNNSNQPGKIEVCFTDDIGRTFLGVLTPGGGGNTPQNVKQLTGPATADASGGLPKFEKGNSNPLNLHGHLLTYEMTGPALTSNQVWENACGLALCLTMANHVTIDTGFSEMVLTNVDLPVEEVADAAAPEGVRQEPLTIFRGSGTVNNFTGIQDTGANNEEKTLTPGVHWKEPTSLESHKTGVDLHYTAILREVRQMHALISGDATASGESRKQAIADFIDATTALLLEFNDFGQWLIETALYLAANILGRQDLLDLRGRFEAQVNAGALSSDEEAQILAQVEKKVRSKKSARPLLRIFDNDAEDRQIKQETLSDALFSTIVPLSPKDQMEADAKAANNHASNGDGSGNPANGNVGNPAKTSKTKPKPTVKAKKRPQPQPAPARIKQS